MENTAALYLLVTGIASIFCVVGYALAAWREGSRSTRKATSKDEPSTPISAAHYQALRAEMAELFSTLEKLTTTVKRISSRQGMRDLREREIGSDWSNQPPVGTSKAELRRIYAEKIANAANGGVPRDG